VGAAAAGQQPLPPWALYGAVGTVAALIGVLAGLNPPVGIVTALGFAFVVLTMANLTAGFCMFAGLTFVDQVLPTAGVLSLTKVIGLLLLLSWVAVITVGGRTARRSELFSHPWLLYVLLLFGAWIALSATWAEERGAALTGLVQFIPLAALFLIVFTAVRTRGQAVAVIAAFTVGAIVSAAYGLAVPTDPTATDRLSGGAGNANETAAALVAGATLLGALAAGLRRQPVLRLVATAGVPFLVFGIFLTLSRGGLVAMGAALIATIAFAGRWRPQAVGVAIVGVLSAVVYFGAFAPAGAKDRVTALDGGTGRTDVWTVGWRMVEDHPVRGIGNGNFANTSVHYLLRPGAIVRDDFIIDTPKVAHNSYLEVLAELGIVGLALFLTVLGFALACIVRAARLFRRLGDRQMELLSRALFVALVGLLASDFFGSRQYEKQLWLLLALGPAFLALARAQLEAGSSERAFEASEDSSSRESSPRASRAST
jgi:O-antigen ligase